MKTPKPKKEMQAEPATTYPDGSVSDVAEHSYMLDNPVACKMANAMGIQAARNAGLTEEEIQMLGMDGPEDMEQFKDLPAKKMDLIDILNHEE
jgi:hypothetical protein